MKSLNLLNRVPVYILRYCSNGLGSIKRSIQCEILWSFNQKVLLFLFKMLNYNNLLILSLQWSLFYASLMRTQNIVELQFIRTC